MTRLAKLAALALAATSFAAPASAVVTTFASFAPVGVANNVRWLISPNNAGGNFSRDAVFYTTATGNATVPGARNVSFTFLQSAFNSLGTLTARWQLNGAITNTVATINGANIVQNNIAGSFSFTSTAPIVFGETFYATGSNLLSGTFTNSTISGARGATSGGFSGSTPTSTITYVSDFLTFVPGSNYDFAISLTQIANPLNALPTNGTPTRALRSFRAVAGGQFSSDPAPVVPGIPEPAVWAQLIVGFTLVGFAARRRKIVIAA